MREICMGAAQCAEVGGTCFHRTLWGCSLTPPHFRPQEASLHCPVHLLSPVPTYGAAQAMEVCVRVAMWWCRKDPAHEGGAWKAFARVSVPSHDLVLCTSSV